MSDQTNINNGVADPASPPNPAAATPNPAQATDAKDGNGQGAADPSGKPNEPAKTEGDKPKEGEGKDDKPQVAPEKYEDFKLPEGFVLEGERLEMAHEFAKTNKWTQEQAQQGVETYLKFRAAEVEYERGLWGAQSESEFGKEFKTIADGAQRALVFAEKERPGITERLDKTNLGNHPDVLWAFNKLGILSKAPALRGMQNDNGPSTAQSLAEKLYDKK